MLSLFLYFDGVQNLPCVCISQGVLPTYTHHCLIRPPIIIILIMLSVSSLFIHSPLPTFARFWNCFYHGNQTPAEFATCFLSVFSTSLLSSCIYSQTPRSRRSTLFSFLPFPTISLRALSPLKSRLLWSLCLFPNQPLVHLHCCPPLNNLRVTVPWALRRWHLTYSFLLCCELFMIIACAFMWENKSSALNLAIPWPAHFQWPSAFISNSLMNSLPSTSSPLKSWNHLSHSDHNHFIVFLTSWTFLDLWTPTFSASALFLYHFV